MNMIHKTYKCRLCEQLFSESEMSEEHYPAKCVGNNDIIALDFIKMMDSLQSGKVFSEVAKGLESGKDPKDAAEKYFDDKLAKPLYPNGRTARTLCRKCNTFLGKYDEAYQKFFDADGQSRIINGFQAQTKIQIIKALYAKFLSVPEAQEEKFDFLNFVRDTSCVEYTGKWHLYFVKRDFSSDLMGLKDIGTGKLDFDEGVVYELSDDKFIFDLMNFEKHSCFEMTDIFDIRNKNYKLIEGVGASGGYHAQILMQCLFRDQPI